MKKIKVNRIKKKCSLHDILTTEQIMNIAIDICDVFEGLLERYDIKIPDEDRQGDESEARIYGETYFELEYEIKDILSNIQIDITKVNNTKIIKKVIESIEKVIMTR